MHLSPTPQGKVSAKKDAFSLLCQINSPSAPLGDQYAGTDLMSANLSGSVSQEATRLVTRRRRLLIMCHRPFYLHGNAQRN